MDLREDLTLTYSLAGQSGTYTAAIVVPEPATFLLLGMGAIGLLAYAWQRRRR